MSTIAQQESVVAGRGAADVAAAAQLACLLEVSAPKPGNVSPGRHFGDTRYEDFLASAVAVGGPLGDAGSRPLGVTIRSAVEATGRWTRSNTNLGIVLLLAPLARAACLGGGLRTRLRTVLETTTVEDARDVYAAIRAAAPGGLGRVASEDVSDDPTVTLLEAMRLAADRDGIAREYVTTFDVTFETGVPALERARANGLAWDDAVVEMYLTLLALRPDSHVIRRAGIPAATELAGRAKKVLDLGGVRTVDGRRAIDELDGTLRDARNSANPGTTADLTAAAIFVLLLEGGWSSSPEGEARGAHR